MCFHDLIIHMCTGSVKPQFIMIMVVNVVYLLLLGRRARLPFDHETPMEIFEPIKQELTEHSTILHPFIMFATRHVIQLAGVGFDCIQ